MVRRQTSSAVGLADCKTNQKSILESVPKCLPSLLRAQKLQKKARKEGFDWNQIGDVFNKLDEEITEFKEAVVGYPHDIKGNGLYCYVTLNSRERPSGELVRDLKLWVRKQIGPIATPDFIQFAPGLPKTRSGKIMRRILRKIAANKYDQLGDITTLADPSVVDSLVENRQNK